MRRLFGSVFALLLLTAAAHADGPPPASREEIIEAYGVLREWTEAFQAKDYQRQRMLTDARIRKWHDRKRWRKWMRDAQKRNGDLISYEVESAAPAEADQLPCTEHGHCFRPGVQYIIYMISSEYEKVEPPQPEFVVMAKSDEGWRFGGGTFLNRPMGETSVIMTLSDERRYRPGYDIWQ